MCAFLRIIRFQQRAAVFGLLQPGDGFEFRAVGIGIYDLIENSRPGIVDVFSGFDAVVCRSEQVGALRVAGHGDEFVVAQCFLCRLYQFGVGCGIYTGHTVFAVGRFDVEVVYAVQLIRFHDIFKLENKISGLLVGHIAESKSRISACDANKHLTTAFLQGHEVFVAVAQDVLQIRSDVEHGPPCRLVEF